LFFFHSNKSCLISQPNLLGRIDAENVCDGIRKGKGKNQLKNEKRGRLKDASPKTKKMLGVVCYA